MNNINELKESLISNTIHARDAERLVPDIPGIYCILIREAESVPIPYREELKIRNHNILYVGQASTSLLKRLVQQDLRHKSPASFFRSIGAIIGFKPIQGTSKNYKFSNEDTTTIVEWINKNLVISWRVIDVELLDKTEKTLINDMKPIINIKDNPFKLKVLQELRKQCIRLATQGDGYI